MTTKFMKPNPLIIVFSLLILSSIALAQNIDLDISGTCNYYNVTLTASDFSEACYDVKIDPTYPEGRGEIYDEREGWKSSFYYINEIFCIEEGNASETFRLRTSPGPHELNATLNFLAKLRLDDRTWESSYYAIDQDCPIPEDNTMFVFAVALVVILILLALITLYVKVWK